MSRVFQKVDDHGSNDNNNDDNHDDSEQIAVVGEWWWRVGTVPVLRGGSSGVEPEPSTTSDH
jgi:hypothetical protein